MDMVNLTLKLEKVTDAKKIAEVAKIKIRKITGFISSVGILPREEISIAVFVSQNDIGLLRNCLGEIEGVGSHTWN